MMIGDEKSTGSSSPAVDVEAAAKTQAVDGIHADSNQQQDVWPTWTTSPENPYNFPSSRKITIILVVSLSHLATTMSASMIAPSLDQIAEELSLSATTTLIASSIFLLGLGFGPFIIGPMSEMYGRKPVWIICNLFYILWNSLSPVGHSAGLLIAGRLLAGFGACSGIGLLGPVSADLYTSKDRGKSIAIATFLPFIGPALGPIIGGLASQHIHWSWTFWILSIFNALATIAGVFLIKETHHPLLCELHGFSSASTLILSSTTTTTMQEKPNPKQVRAKIRNNLLRPIRLLIYRPIIVVISINAALDFAVYFLALSTFATLWIQEYGQSESTSSLHYIAITIGALLATQIGGRLMDWLYKAQVARAAAKGAAAAASDHVGSNNRSTPNISGTDRQEAIDIAAKARTTTFTAPTATTTITTTAKPEIRILFLVPATILTPAGLLWYGWAAEQHSHWALVDAGMLLFVFANFMFSAGFLAYLLDEFTGGGEQGGGGGGGDGEQTASATAATKMLSYVLAFVFPLFAPRLYDGMGYGWGNTLLAGVWVIVAVPSLVGFGGGGKF